MCTGLEPAVLGAIIGGGASIGSAYLGVQEGKKNRQAQQQATAKAEAAAAANKPPQAAKSPDLAAISAMNAKAGGQGNGSTFLTGAQGIDPSSLNLGRNSLLGQ